FISRILGILSLSSLLYEVVSFHSNIFYSPFYIIFKASNPNNLIANFLIALFLISYMLCLLLYFTFSAINSLGNLSTYHIFNTGPYSSIPSSILISSILIYISFNFLYV